MSCTKKIKFLLYNSLSHLERKSVSRPSYVFINQDLYTSDIACFYVFIFRGFQLSHLEGSFHNLTFTT